MKNKETLLKQFAKGQVMESQVASSRNCVIYTRVSSKEQAETNQSLEWQKKYCHDFALKNGLNILGYFGGTYESAKSDERKEFNRMLKFVKTQKEKVSHILVYSLDRFSRTGDSAIYIASELKKTGVNILAVTQPIDTNSHAGALQQNIQFIFSKYDNDLRRQKSIDGMREKLLRGDWLGNPPTGYAYDHIRGHEAQRIVITEKGELIKQAFIWRSEGRTYEEIIQRLFKAGLRMPNQTLTDIFRNPFYCGFLSHNLLGGELVRGNHPSLINEDLFLTVNKLRGTDGYKIKVAEENLPLKVFVKHAQTGVAFTGYLVKKKNKYYYKVNKVGVKVNRSIQIMHEKFKEILNFLSIHPSYVEPLKAQLLNTLENFTESNPDLKRSLSKQIKDVESKIEKLEERHALGEVSLDIYLKFSSKYVEEKNTLIQELEKLNGKLSNPKELIDFVCKFASKLSHSWESADYYQKQTLQNLVFPEGIMYDTEIEHYRTGKVRPIFLRMAAISRASEEKESRSFEKHFENSGSVPRAGIEPA